MRITSKGQVTIPIEIREKLGLLPHTEVVFAVEGDAATIRKTGDSEQGRGAVIVRHLRGRGTVNLSTDEILALTRSGE